MDQLVKKINSGTVLGFDEALRFFNGMLENGLTEAQVGSCLVSMTIRGETSDELAALVQAMSGHMKCFEPAGRGADTCGTGGDGKSTLNVSTAVSIILASMGHEVVKHGNSAQSGKVGSADLLKNLGFDLTHSGGSPREFYEKHNFVFLFAPLYHPALKDIGKVRREIKVPSIFNLAGPLVNPASPRFQIIGINRADRLDFVADAALRLGRNHVTVYSSEDGYDEVSTIGRTRCVRVLDGAKESFTINPADYFQPFPMPVVRDAAEARDLFVAGLGGKDEAIVNLLSLNTGLALDTIESCGLGKGYRRARSFILSGEPLCKLNEMIAS